MKNRWVCAFVAVLAQTIAVGRHGRRAGMPRVAGGLRRHGGWGLRRHMPDEVSRCQALRHRMPLHDGHGPRRRQDGSQPIVSRALRGRPRRERSRRCRHSVFPRPVCPPRDLPVRLPDPRLHRLRPELRGANERRVGHGGHGLLVAVVRRRRRPVGPARSLARALEGRRCRRRRRRRGLERHVHRAAPGAGRRLLRVEVARRLRPVGPLPS